MLEHFANRQPRANPQDVVEYALTAREMDVLRLLGRGLRVAAAARVLGPTPHTVAGCVKAVYRKLNISSRAEAAVEAADAGWFSCAGDDPSSPGADACAVSRVLNQVSFGDVDGQVPRQHEIPGIKDEERDQARILRHPFDE
jgi:DNA-binding CsgD family transcriptional regulator